MKNLASLSKEEIEKISVDLAAAGIAFKERYNIPVVEKVIEDKQPIHLLAWFRERLILHRSNSVLFSRLPYKKLNNSKK